jgi:hypothetical protein
MAHTYNPGKAEIRKTAIQGQPGQKNLQDPILMEKNLGVMVHTYHPSYSRKHKIGGSQSRLPWSKSKTLSPK